MLMGFLAFEIVEVSRDVTEQREIVQVWRLQANHARKLFEQPLIVDLILYIVNVVWSTPSRVATTSTMKGKGKRFQDLPAQLEARLLAAEPARPFGSRRGSETMMTARRSPGRLPLRIEHYDLAEVKLL